MDLKVLQYLMGHKSSKITNDIYNHVTQERATQEVLKVAKIQAKQAYIFITHDREDTERYEKL